MAWKCTTYLVALHPSEAIDRVASFQKTRHPHHCCCYHCCFDFVVCWLPFSSSCVSQINNNSTMQAASSVVNVPCVCVWFWYFCDLESAEEDRSRLTRKMESIFSKKNSIKLWYTELERERTTNKQTNKQTGQNKHNNANNNHDHSQHKAKERDHISSHTHTHKQTHELWV